MPNFPIRRYNPLSLQRVRHCLFSVVMKYAGFIHCLRLYFDIFCNICANFCQLFALIGAQKGIKSKINALVKNQQTPFSVIPAKAGIQYFQSLMANLDPGFRLLDDDFLGVHQS